MTIDFTYTTTTNMVMYVTQEEWNMIIKHRENKNAVIRKEIEELKDKNKRLKKAINRKNKALKQPAEFDISDDEKEFDNDDAVVET